MKRILSTLIIILTSVAVFSQNDQTTCNLGFSFKISNNPNWGNNEPIVTEVTPGSPAEKVGLKVNDIILEVNGNGTYLKPSHTIMSWFMEKPSDMSISIRNFEVSFKPMNIAKDCRLRNAISEAQLAPVFSFYSLEDVQDRRFIIPVKTIINPDADFFNYRTYDFAPSDESSKEMDDRINSIFVKALSQIGLKHDSEDPDFIIQTFYSYQNNSMFKLESPTRGTYPGTWRFDVRNNRMVKIPVYDPTLPVKIDDVMYDLEFGYRFYDRKFTEPGKSMLVWESEVKEQLSNNYGLLNYLEMNLPLILRKFPNSGNLKMATYHVKSSRYNYTGINYDLNDLKTIVAIDTGSPADRAGIKVGDVVMKVQDHNFNHDAKSLTASYRRFIAETMKYRDQATKYTDAHGFQNAMYWDIIHYNNVSKEINDKKRYKSGFSYLFNFNQYIDWNTPSSISFEVERDEEILTFEIKPIIISRSQISVE
ncbi:MAG: PDZ domain-containing protein [Bacteroidia bacterium]|nr:PDZ domain-containing protein [Bacteroidia bacterium]